MNQADDFTLDFGHTQQRLEHMAKTRPKRVNIRRPTLKRPQTETDDSETQLENTQEIKNETQLVDLISKKLKLDEIQKEKEEPEPAIKQPIISSNVLETVKLRRGNPRQFNPVNVTQNKTFRFSMYENVNVVNNQEACDVPIRENKLEINNQERPSFIRIKTSRPVIAPNRQLSVLAEDNASSKKEDIDDKKESVQTVKLRSKPPLNKNEPKTNEVNKRFSMFTTLSSANNNNNLGDDRPVPISIKDRIKLFEK